VGDRIVSINGDRLFYRDDFTLFMNLNTGSHVNMVINRGGENITLNNFPLERRNYEFNGEMHYRYGITLNRIESTAWEVVKYSAYQTYNFVRMIRLSIAMMVSGAATLRDISGPVGIVDAMNTIGQEAETTTIAIGNIILFTAFIGVNVAVINLLPIPAMDGGRILFIFLTWLIEITTRKRLDPKYEGYINTGAFFLLIGLMVLVLYNDVSRIISS